MHQEFEITRLKFWNRAWPQQRHVSQEFETRAKAEDHLIKNGWTPPKNPDGQWTHYHQTNLRAAITPRGTGESTIVILSIWEA